MQFKEYGDDLENNTESRWGSWYISVGNHVGVVWVSAAEIKHFLVELVNSASSIFTRGSTVGSFVIVLKNTIFTYGHKREAGLVENIFAANAVQVSIFWFSTGVNVPSWFFKATVVNTDPPFRFGWGTNLINSLPHIEVHLWKMV